MLEYSKIILEKVSFDQKLFRKEYRKAVKMLNEEEAGKLHEWCLKHFGPLSGCTIIRFTPKRAMQAIA